MKASFIFSYFCLLFVTNLSAQTAEPSAAIDKNLLQIEMSVQYTVQKSENEKEVTWSLPSSLFRFGAFNNMELQLSVPFVKEFLYVDNNLLTAVNCFDDIQMGSALTLFKQKELIPETEFMLRICGPLENRLKFDKIGYTMAFNFSNAITDEYAILFNIGYTHVADGSNVGYHVLNLSYNLSDKVHFFVENFSEFNSNFSSIQSLNLGGGVFFMKNVSLDFSFAKGLNYNLFCANTLLTWSVDTKHKKY